MKKKLTKVFYEQNDPSTWPMLLTLTQTAEILNISKWTLRNWDNDGKLKAVRIGTRKDRRYKKEDVLRILKA